MDYKDLFIEGMTVEQFNEIAEKISQSSSDKVRTEYSSKIKELENQVPKQKTDAEKDFEERLKALESEENEYKLMDALSENGLPTELSKYVKGIEGMDEFKEVIQKFVLDGSFQPTKHKSTETTVTKEAFSKMGYSERAKLAESQPEVYKALSQQ